MDKLSKIIDGAEQTRYNLSIAASVAKEAAGYLDRDLKIRDNMTYLAVRQDDVLNLFSAALTFLNDAKKDLAETLDLLYELNKVGADLDLLYELNKVEGQYNLDEAQADK
jgi:hypothetical protein